MSTGKPYLQVRPLSSIRNEPGFKFIGIDKDGKRHQCHVIKGEDYCHYISSNTATLDMLIGWIPDSFEQYGVLKKGATNDQA